jgi:hypothetical protein
VGAKSRHSASDTSVTATQFTSFIGLSSPVNDLGNTPSVQNKY